MRENDDVPRDSPTRVCELVLAIKHVMMLKHVHAEFTVKEVLDKFGVASVQELAHQAQEMAERCLAKGGRNED